MGFHLLIFCTLLSSVMYCVAYVVLSDWNSCSLSSGEGDSEAERGNAAVGSCPSRPPVSRPLFNNRLSCATSPSVHCRDTTCIVCPNKMQIVTHLFKSHSGHYVFPLGYIIKIICPRYILRCITSIVCALGMQSASISPNWYYEQKNFFFGTEFFNVMSRSSDCYSCIVFEGRGGYRYQISVRRRISRQVFVFSSVILVKYWNTTSE